MLRRCKNMRIIDPGKIEFGGFWRTASPPLPKPAAFFRQKMMTPSVNKCTNLRATGGKQQIYGGYVCFIQKTDVRPGILNFIQHLDVFF